MSDDIKDKVIWYWQDSLAKFFPTSKGPTGTEIEMFRAGYEAGSASEELTRAHQEGDRLREALSKIANGGVEFGKLANATERMMAMTEIAQAALEGE